MFSFKKDKNLKESSVTYGYSGEENFRIDVPCKIIMLVKPGDKLRKGEPACIAERMKMEIPMSVDTDCFITSVTNYPGDIIKPSDIGKDGCVVFSYDRISIPVDEEENSNKMVEKSEVIRLIKNNKNYNYDLNLQEIVKEIENLK